MAKKTKREGAPKLSKAQLQAYKVRKAETIAQANQAVVASAVEDASIEEGVEYTSWGRVDEEYSIIRKDLRTLLTITALMLVILIVLTFVFI